MAGADALLRQQVKQLGEVALQLDRGEISPDAARTLCALAATEAGKLADTLAAIPGAAENKLCAALIDQLRKLAQMQDEVARGGQTDATALSGMLRCAQIEGFLNQWETNTALSRQR